MLNRNCYLLICTVIFFLLPFLSFALEVDKILSVPISNDFNLHPAKIELKMNPGERATGAINILNRSGEIAEFEISFEDINAEMVASRETSMDVGSRSLSEFLSTDSKKFRLSHGEQAIVTIDIKLPNDIRGGGLSGAVIVSSRRLSDVSEGGGTKLVARLGALLFVNVSRGVSIQSGRVSDFVYSDGSFKIKFENSGNTNINPYGKIDVSDVSGKVISTIKIDPWFVLPGSVRLKEVSWVPPVSMIPFYKVSLAMYPGYGGEEGVERFNLWIYFYENVAAFFLLVILIVAVLISIKYARKTGK